MNVEAPGYKNIIDPADIEVMKVVTIPALESGVLDIYNIVAEISPEK